MKAAETLLSAYGLVPELEDNDALDRILDIFSAVVFYVPAQIYSKAFQGRSYLLHFDQKNSFDGPLHGRASHILDVAYLFQNFNEHLTSTEVQVAEIFTEKMIAFIAGQKPWKNYDEAGTAFILGDGLAQELSFSEYKGRKTVIWKIVEEVGADKLISVLFAYMSGAH